MIPGLEINVFLLLFLSLAAGTISGFVGVGGGFIMTPALIIMGFPAQQAVGTGVLWVMGNSIIGTLRHRKLGNVDIKLGLFIIVFMMTGIELGIRLLDTASRAGMGETAVLSVTIVMLILIGSSVFRESVRTKSKLDKVKKEKTDCTNEKTGKTLASIICAVKVPPVIHFPKSGVSVSLWILMVIGLGAGILAGFIGVGGGFVLVPSMVYLFGVPSYIAVGTSLFQIIFPSAFGAARYTIDGNVIVFVSFIMITGSSAGIYFGALLTRYLHDIAMKYGLALTIIVAVIGSILKLLTILLDTSSAWLEISMSVITFGGLAVIFFLSVFLYITAARHKQGKYIPSALQSFIKD